MHDVPTVKGAIGIIYIISIASALSTPEKCVAVFLQLFIYDTHI
jgi:hypothetical protein